MTTQCLPQESSFLPVPNVVFAMSMNSHRLLVTEAAFRLNRPSFAITSVAPLTFAKRVVETRS